jgi:hypothetical protein
MSSLHLPCPPLTPPFLLSRHPVSSPSLNPTLQWTRGESKRWIGSTSEKERCGLRDHVGTWERDGAAMRWCAADGGAGRWRWRRGDGKRLRARWVGVTDGSRRSLQYGRRIVSQLDRTAIRGSGTADALLPAHLSPAFPINFICWCTQNQHCAQKQ